MSQTTSVQRDLGVSLRRIGQAHPAFHLIAAGQLCNGLHSLRCGAAKLHHCPLARVKVEQRTLYVVRSVLVAACQLLDGT